MDGKRFTPQSPGAITPIIKQDGTSDLAFVPNEMPPAWEFDPKLWPLLVDAREALGTLNGIGQTLPNPQLLLRPLQTREAVTSSSIEGTHVTAAQLLLYELDPKEPTPGDSASADWQEVFNHTRALQRGVELLAELPFCNRLIRDIHLVLMQGVRGFDKSPGRFRTVHVQVGSSGRFIPPPASEVERLMADFERYINGEFPEVDPLIRCYLAHYQFEAIHPFRDGNGRVGRVLLTLMISRWMKHAMPWLYMSAFFEEFEDEYVRNLFEVSTEGRWSQWIEFCLRGTIAQARDSIRRCHAFKKLHDSYYEQIRSNCPGPRIHQIVDMLFTYPVLTVPAVVKGFGITYHTARQDLEKLAECGVLREVNNSRPRTFVAQQLMQIAYNHEFEDLGLRADAVENESLGTADAGGSSGEPPPP